MITYTGSNFDGSANWYCSICSEYFSSRSYLQGQPAHTCPTGILSRSTPIMTESKALEKFKSVGSKSGDSHYTGSSIQPIDLIVSAKLPFLEGEIVAVMCRWRKKGGIKDLKKALGYVQLLIDLEGTSD